MATTVEANANPDTPTSQRPATPKTALGAPWYERHQRLLIGGGLGILAAAAIGYFIVESGERKEQFAARTLDQAQIAAESGNLPLASSELQKLISTYKGTDAANQAVLALNQIRLYNDQGALAVGNLREFLASNPDPRYGVPAAGLLGAALENNKQWGEAGDAYIQASQKAQADYLKASYLTSAGRAYRAGGLTDKAITAYGTVVEKYAKTPSLVEAQLRLAELTKGQQGATPDSAAGTAASH